MKKVIVIGAGLGGMSTALRLAKSGYQVEIIEKFNQPGGRLNQLKKDGFTFDIGPTFFSMTYEFTDFAKACGIEMPFQFIELEKLYNVKFRGKDRIYEIYKDLDLLAEQFNDLEPDFKAKMTRFLHKTSLLFNEIEYKVLKRNFNSLFDFLTATTQVSPRYAPLLWRSVWQHLAREFTCEEVKVIFSLVAFFLGDTPFNTSAVFSVLTYTELEHDGYHNVKGGMYKIVEGMASELEKAGVITHYNTEIIAVEQAKNRVVAVKSKRGEIFTGDLFVVNADAAWFRGVILERPKFAPAKLDKMQWTMAPLTIYLGVKGKVDNLDLHNYILGENFTDYARKIFKNSIKFDKPYYYVNVSSRKNPETAPDGCEAIFILCPVPDLRFKPDWSDTDEIVNTIIEDLSIETGYDIKNNIVSKTVYNPIHWQNMFNLYRGSGLGLGHKISQVGHFRPKNQDEKLKNLFYVGASTTPGTGLPMMMISSKLVCERIEQYEENLKS